MKIKNLFVIVLVFALVVGGCATVEQSIVVDDDAEPDKSYEVRMQARGTSSTLEEKKIIEKIEHYQEFEKKEILPQVKPKFKNLFDFSIIDNGSSFVISMNDGKGEFTITHITDTNDDGHKWLLERIGELASMGFVFDGNVDVENLSIVGDNRDSPRIMGKDYNKYFDPEVLTMVSFVGNKDCIWEAYGYVKSPMDTQFFTEFIKMSGLEPWEK